MNHLIRLAVGHSDQGKGQPRRGCAKLVGVHPPNGPNMVFSAFKGFLEVTRRCLMIRFAGHLAKMQFRKR